MQLLQPSSRNKGEVPRVWSLLVAQTWVLELSWPHWVILGWPIPSLSFCFLSCNVGMIAMSQQDVCSLQCLVIQAPNPWPANITLEETWLTTGSGGVGISPLASPNPWPFGKQSTGWTFNNLYKEHWTLGTETLPPCLQGLKSRMLFPKVQKDSKQG